METHRSVQHITSEAALQLVHAALAEAKKIGVGMSVAVVDPSMTLVAFVRADGATPHSLETSKRKANTAASTGRATGWMNAELAVQLPAASGNLLTNILGGVPIKFKGVLVGGLGVAGGTVEQDSLVAKAALHAIGADSLN